MKRIIALCETGKYDQALDLISEKIKSKDISSELYRLQGQVYFDQEKYDDSLNSLIESLKLDPENQFSLILIGNIYGTIKKDIDTALTYYKKVLESNSKDVLSISNIASVLAMNGKVVEAEEYFDKALSINASFPNALFGMALINFNRSDNSKAFSFITKCLKSVPYKNEYKSLRQNAEKLAFEIAKAYTIDYNTRVHSNPLLESLLKVSNKQIEIEIDNSIDTPAKLEVAEYKGKEKHIVKYKEDSEVTVHYLYHELLHLKLIFDARRENVNELFTSSNEHFKRFKNKFKGLVSNLAKKGLEASTEGLFGKLFNGLNLQLFNAPLDLFIEDSIYQNYKDIRPIQFMSLKSMIDTVFEGVNSKTLKGIVPEQISQKSLILAVPQMILYNELFGIDFTRQIKDKYVLNKGRKLYNDFLELRNDKADGEEYDVIRWWAEELSLNPYFDLVLESKYGTKTESLEEQIGRIESDPLNLDGDSSFEDQELEKFIKANRNDDLNMAVVFHMIDSLKYISNLKIDTIQKIGFEIATVGRLGIDPNKDDKYNLDSVKGRSFSGWQMLSWMYVTWKNFNPEMADQLGLEFKREYELAMTMSKS